MRKGSYTLILTEKNLSLGYDPGSVQPYVVWNVNDVLVGKVVVDTEYKDAMFFDSYNKAVIEFRKRKEILEDGTLLEAGS